MMTAIGQNLVLVPIPQSLEIGNYSSFDIESKGIQVGKARCRIEGQRLTIFSIGIYPEFQRQGYARAVVEHFKAEFAQVIADRVRFTARPFWEELGFREDGNSGDYSWDKSWSSSHDTS